MEQSALRLMLTLALGFQITPAAPQSFLERTQLVDLQVGKGLSEFVLRASDGSYELENGQLQNFRDWYQRKSIDVELKFATEIQDGRWLRWGFSTGEYGMKYTIKPSLTLGFESISDLANDWAFWVRVETKLGGGLVEEPCFATYTLADGARQVNCRLAASPLPPEETLQYLWRLDPENRVSLNAFFVFAF